VQTGERTEGEEKEKEQEQEEEEQEQEQKQEQEHEQEQEHSTASATREWGGAPPACLHCGRPRLPPLRSPRPLASNPRLLLSLRGRTCGGV
jgi:hypothetical protein